MERTVESHGQVRSVAVLLPNAAVEIFHNVYSCFVLDCRASNDLYCVPLQNIVPAARTIIVSRWFPSQEELMIYHILALRQ